MKVSNQLIIVKEELVKEELVLGLLQSNHMIKFYKAYDGG
jgi:hypothetical protein